jgi:hypothetical protein
VLEARPVQPYNRESRRKLGKQVVHDFKRLAKQQGWGQWEKLDPNTESRKRGMRNPLTGMVAFWKNNVYSVQVYHQDVPGLGQVQQLCIRKHDGKARVPWADKQRIKDELVGQDYTAIEVFPTAANLVDEADLYHLWVMPLGYEFPFGLHIEGWSK